MDQIIINWILGGFGLLISFLLGVIWNTLRDLQKNVSDLEVLVAGDYVKRDDYGKTVTRLFDELKTIDTKLTDFIIASSKK